VITSSLLYLQLECHGDHKQSVMSPVGVPLQSQAICYVSSWSAIAITSSLLCVQLECHGNHKQSVMCSVGVPL
jgi:hypothetical protein